MTLSPVILGKSLTFPDPSPQGGANVLKVIGPAEPPLDLAVSGHGVLPASGHHVAYVGPDFPLSYSTCGASSSSVEGKKYNAVWVLSPWLIFFFLYSFARNKAEYWSLLIPYPFLNWCRTQRSVLQEQ